MVAKQATLLKRFVGQVADKYRDKQESDRELLRRFVERRDEAAFGVLVRRHGAMVLGTALRVLRHRQNAEDVSQAAFLILARKANRIAWHDSVANWLYEVAHHLARKARDAAQRRQARERHVKSRQPPDAMTEITARDLQAVLDEELRGLPNKYRAPIILCCLEGKTRDEAAACLGVPLASVKSRLEEGRELLRRRLERRGVLLSTAFAGLTLSQTACAALPAAFANVTSHAALQIVAGQTNAGLVSANVAALIKGGIQTMFLTKLKVATALALTACILGIGVVTLASPGLTTPQEPPDSGAKPDAPRKTQRDLLAQDRPATAEKAKAKSDKKDVWRAGGVAEPTDGVIESLVTSVDTDKNTISVRIPQIARLSGDGEEIVMEKDTKLSDLPVSKKAKITINGKEGKLDQLKEGYHVSLQLSVRSEVWVKAIDATVKKGKKDK
jgi:RNA polymerase sigma factor (sigma-70 family)